MGTRYRWAFVILIAAVAVGAIAAMAVMTRDRETVQIQTADVTSGPVARHILVTGALEPLRMVEVGSQVSGTIASLPADFNARVSAGQVLARLDQASFHSRLAEAQAGLAKAQADHLHRQAALNEARMKLEDAQALAGDQQLARAELDLARTTMLHAAADVKGAEADIAAARASVTQAQIGLDRTIIRSPIDGVVIGRHVEIGQTIAASVQAPVLFTIGDLRRMRLLAEVPEGEVGGVQPGSQVRFEIEAINSRQFAGTVAEVRLAPQVASATTANAAIPAATTPVATSGSTSSTTRSTTSATTQTSGSTTSGSTSSQLAAQSTVSPPIAATTSTGRATGTVGLVTYVAVIDVDAPGEEIPPGGTAVVTLAGSQRKQAVRIPNNALTFAPSPDALIAVDQEPPVLERAGNGPAKQAGTRHGYVWKFESNRFVPIAVETGISDDSWTEVVSGAVRPGDRLVTAAVPLKRGS
jgi:HlyD family secretion protein